MEEPTKQETRDTLQIAAGYSAEVNRQITRNLNWMSWLGVAAFSLYGALEVFDLAAEGWTMYLADFALGAALHPAGAGPDDGAGGQAAVPPEKKTLGERRRRNERGLTASLTAQRLPDY